MIRRKQIIATIFLFVVMQSPLAALGLHLGVRAEGGITRGYGKIGLYDFVGRFDKIDLADPDVDTIRSMNQMVQFSGGFNVFAQLSFNSWYTLMPEIGMSFNRGLSYSGNYTANVIVGKPDYVELTGEMRYGWNVLTINLINQFTVVRPNQMIGVHLLAGPAMTVILGRVKEEFRPEFGVNAGNQTTNRPFNEGYERKFNPGRRFDIGLTAGIGTDIDFGKAGRLSFDVRTTWYFVPQIYTYPSPNNRVKMSVPISLNLGYAFKLF